MGYHVRVTSFHLAYIACAIEFVMVYVSTAYNRIWMRFLAQQRVGRGDGNSEGATATKEQW